MPPLNEIRAQVQSVKQNIQDRVRQGYLSDLFKHTGRNVVLYAATADMPKLKKIPAQLLQVSISDLQGFMSAFHGLKGDKLDLILHSQGGSIEAAEQIVQYVRSKFNHVRAIVPQNAMSAATMLACACDEIVLGKHSAIGPIDPQMVFQNQVTPAQAILDDFERAKQEVIQDHRVAPLWASMFAQMPNGTLSSCTTAMDLARTKAAEWLDRYMFRTEQTTEGEETKGTRIANWLGNHKEHKTHGRPISIDVAREKGLKVTALEEDNELQELVLSIFHASMVTFEQTPCVKIIENHEGKGNYLIVQQGQSP